MVDLLRVIPARGVAENRMICSTVSGVLPVAVRLIEGGSLSRYGSSKTGW
jgi:hypothetical protein